LFPLQKVKFEEIKNIVLIQCPIFNLDTQIFQPQRIKKKMF